MMNRSNLLLFGLLFSVAPTLAFAQAKQKPISRAVNTQGVRGTVTLSQLTPEHVEIVFKTRSGEMRDTMVGKGINPVIVNGRKQNFYVGRFGSSPLPMLVLSLRDPDRIQDSRTLSYQLTPAGGFIGQKVLIDESLEHKYTDNTSGGRHYLAAVDTKLGTIYSLAYQRASFAGFYHTYEKLRVRQWEPSIDAFIETDQGFLRDRKGAIMESGKFNVMSESQRQQIFVANVMPPAPAITKSTSKPRMETPVKQASIR
jgi:hypothetical protein